MNKLDCTVIGDAMIDIVLPLPDVKDLNNLLQRGIINTEYKISPGGTANIAVGISKLGGKSAFIGKVGDDYFGEIFIKDLEANKVLKGVSISKTKRTGIVFALVLPSGERIFIVDRGANEELRYEDIDFNLVRDSRFLCFVGFSFQNKESSETIQKVITEASKNSITIVFNPGAPSLASKFKDMFIDIIKNHVDILILIREEGENLTSHSQEEEIIHHLLSQGLQSVVLTKGSKGSVITTKEHIYQIKAYTSRVLDTTGAGDAYTAGFIYGLVRGWREDKAADFASRIAGKVVSQWSARFDAQSLSD